MHFLSSHSWKNQGLIAHSLRKSEQQTPVSNAPAANRGSKPTSSTSPNYLSHQDFRASPWESIRSSHSFLQGEDRTGLPGTQLCHFTAQTFRAAPRPAPQKHFKLTFPGAQYRQQKLHRAVSIPKSLKWRSTIPLAGGETVEKLFNILVGYKYILVHNFMEAQLHKDSCLLSSLLRKPSKSKVMLCFLTQGMSAVS